MYRFQLLLSNSTCAATPGLTKLTQLDLDGNPLTNMPDVDAILDRLAYSAMLAEAAAAAVLIADASDVRAMQALRSASPAGLTLVHFSIKNYTLHTFSGL